MGAAEPSKYNTAATFGGICLRTAGSADIRANPTLAAGDCKISKDGGAFANLATLPSAVPAAGKNIEMALSAAELSCARAVIHFIDQTAPKEWDDFEFIVSTFGHASAKFAPDYASADANSVQNVSTKYVGGTLQTARDIGANVLLTPGTGTGQISLTSGAVTFGNTSIATVTTVTGQLTAAQIATGVWQDTTAGDFTTASSIGKSLYTVGVVPGAFGGFFIAGTNAATTVNITGNITGNLSGNVGSVVGAVGGSVGSVTGNVGGSVASIGANGIQETSFAVNAIGSDAFSQIAADKVWGAVNIKQLSATQTFSNTGTWTGNITGNLSGSVGSVTGAVGSVTGNVGGNVTGSVGSIVTGGIVAGSFAADALSAASLSAAAATKIANEVEAQIIDETDTEKVLLAITNKIAEANPDLSGITLAAIASAVRTNLAVELARINADIDSRMATFVYTAPLDAAGTRTAMGLTTNNLDTQLSGISTQTVKIGTNAADSPAQVTSQTSIGTIATKTNGLNFSGANVLADVRKVNGQTANATAAVDFDDLGGGGGTTNVTVTPVQANSSNPRYSTRAMANLAQGSAPSDIWTFVDAAGAAIDLSGKTVRLVFATVTSLGDDEDEPGNNPIDDTLEGSFKYETGGDGLTVGGADDNQVTLQHDDAKLATAGAYRFFFWQVDDKLLLAKGPVNIEPTVFDVT